MLGFLIIISTPPRATLLTVFIPVSSLVVKQMTTLLSFHPKNKVLPRRYATVDYFENFVFFFISLGNSFLFVRIVPVIWYFSLASS